MDPFLAKLSPAERIKVLRAMQEKKRKELDEAEKRKKEELEASEEQVNSSLEELEAQELEARDRATSALEDELAELAEHERSLEETVRNEAKSSSIDESASYKTGHEAQKGPGYTDPTQPDTDNIYREGSTDGQYGKKEDPTEQYHSGAEKLVRHLSGAESLMDQLGYKKH